MVSKKFLIGIGAVILIVIFAALGNTYIFKGRLVFFEKAPTANQVVSVANISYNEAVDLLLLAAKNTGRITEKQEADLRSLLAGSVERKTLTRAEFASLAVRIFDIKQYSYGPPLSDVPYSRSDAAAVYLFVSNGGMPSAFKPDNPATRQFATEAATSLTARFSPSRSN